MKRESLARGALVALACMSALSALSAPARADDDLPRFKERFNAYKARAAQLKMSPQARYLSGELSALDQWVAKAERELVEDEERSFKREVDRVQVQLQLIEVSVEELDAKEQVARVEQAAEEAEVAAKRDREAVVLLEQQLGGVAGGPPPGQAPAPAPVVAPPPAPVAPPPSN